VMTETEGSKKSLAGAVILISGASSGIGAGTAAHLATLGTRLALVARNKEALEEVRASCEAAGALEVITLSCDLAEETGCQQAVEGTVNHFKCLDVLVNCAGILLSGSVETLSLADYDRIMNINSRSAFLLTQLTAPHLTASKGNMVHVSSVTGTRAFPGVLGYCVSKAALDQLVRCAALDLASKGVRVNAVNPGVILTEIHKRSGLTDENYEKFLEHSKTTHALGRVGTVQEQACQKCNVLTHLTIHTSLFILALHLSQLTLHTSHLTSHIFVLSRAFFFSYKYQNFPLSDKN